VNDLVMTEVIRRLEPEWSAGQVISGPFANTRSST